MLHLVSEQYGFSTEGMEYGLLSPERIAQLEQEDLERYQRSVLKNPGYHDDEATNYQDELQSRLLVLKDMMDRFSNDLKGLTSQFGSGSKPLMTDPQPVSTFYHDEPILDEVSVVVELPESEETKDFDDNTVTGSSNSEEMLQSEEAVVSASAIDSQFSVNPSLHKQLTIVESGFKVLSIYCAHMVPKWNSILDMRPKQRNYMSVEDYYNQFFTWRKKLEEVNYIGDEDSYIDDFIYGLKTELAVRVWVYEWKLRTLYGAFRRAEIEETMMKHDAAKVLEEMPQPNSIVNSIGGSLIYDDSKPKHLVLPIFGILDDQHNACKLSDKMPEPFLEKYLLRIDVEKVAHNLLDEKHVLSPVALDGDFKGKKNPLSPHSYNIETSSSVNESSWISGILIGLSKVISKDLNYEDDVLGVRFDNFPTLSKLGFHLQVFDPGTLAFFKEEEYVRLHFISSELLLVYSLVYGADNSINRNGISMLTRATSSNRPFSDFHVGELAQICPNGDQAAPRLSHGHDIVVGNSNVYVRTVNTLIQTVPLGDEYCFFDFSHFRLFKSDSHAIISLIYDNIAHVDGFSKSLVAGAYSKSLSKLLCYCILSLDSLTTELDLVNCFGSWIGLVSPLRAEFAWDPGICVISVHILEDKDVFKLVGNRIIVRVMIRRIRDGEIKIRTIRIEKGFDSMMICASTIFIFHGNHVLDRHSEVPQLLDKTGLSPTGESYSQNRGSGTDGLLFDETDESFLIELETCVSPNKDFRLSVAEIWRYLRYERLASEILDAFSESVEFIMLNGVEPDPVAMVNGLAACGQLVALNIATGESILFAPRLLSEYAVCLGKIQPPAHFKECYNVNLVHYVDEIGTVLCHKYRGPGKPLMSPLHGLNTGINNFSKHVIFEGILKFETNGTSLHSIVTECGISKSKLELGLIQIANDISFEAHAQVLINIQVGMIFLHTYMYKGCWPCSYTCICIDGGYNSILHYGHAAAPNDWTIADGDMTLLVLYSSAITCSHLVYGRFTQEQCLVYNVVFMPHRLGHLLGIDTHNPGGFLKGVERRKEPGMKALPLVENHK